MTHKHSAHNSGNILIAILIAIALMGALTVVMSDGFSGAKSISDTEMDAKARKILEYSQSVKDAVELLYLQKGLSETEFLFAHQKNHSDYGDDPGTTPEKQVFSQLGGGATFMWPIPEGINNGTPWEFYGKTFAPEVGTTGYDGLSEDLMIVLPNVTESFCRAINKTVGYATTDAIPSDYNSCAIDKTAARWNNSYPSGGGIGNTMDKGSEGWLHTPAPYGCVQCAGPVYYYYYTLLAR